jgi:DNA-binding transcriptional LysR family regulator
VLPDTLASLSQAHPGVSFQVTDDSPMGVIEGLRSGHADIGIGFLDRRHKELELCASINTRIAAIMRADHPLAGRSAVSFTECCAYDIALFSGRLATATIIEAEFQETGAQLNPRIISNSMTVIRTAILKGGAISFQTPIGFIEEISRGEMVAVALERSELSPSGVGLFTVQGSLRSPVVRAVIDRCIDLFATLQQKLDNLAARKSPGPTRPSATRRAGRQPPIKPKAGLPKRARRHESLE